MNTPLPSGSPVNEAPPKKRRGLGCCIFLLVFLALLAGGGYFGYRYYEKKMAERERFRWGRILMPQPLARVPARWSTATLAGRLKKSGKIHDVSAFSEAAEEIHLESIAPGGYALPKFAGPRDLARIFKAGPTHWQVTFPEGFTGWQMAARLKKNGFIGADSFQNLVYPVGKPSPYEGTLFPETYMLPLRSNGKNLLARLQKQFKSEVNSLPKKLPQVKGKPLSVRELVILASLVEREAAGAKEMPMVAAVLLNRLRAPMRLQVDASIQYARLLVNLGHKKRLLNADLKIVSPYNSYQNDGLPPTPICNPGKAALQAAAKPANSPALFYVYSPKLKKSRFAVSYKDHLKNVALARAERAAIEKEANQ